MEFRTVNKYVFTLVAAGNQNKEYLALLAEIKDMRTRQIETDKLVEELRFGETASDRITSDSRRYNTRLDSSATDSIRHFECTRNYNALKTDFDNLQSKTSTYITHLQCVLTEFYSIWFLKIHLEINEKQVQKCSAMKLRLGIVESK